MPKIICTVPEASVPLDQILKTEAAFKAIYAEHFGSAKGLTVLFMRMPAGQTFQAGKQADIYLTMIEVENGLDQTRREAAMWAFTNRWAELLGVDVEQLMITCADADTVAQYMAGNRNRLRPISRIGFMAKTIAHIVRSRRRNGFAELRPNL